MPEVISPDKYDQHQQRTNLSRPPSSQSAVIHVGKSVGHFRVTFGFLVAGFRRHTRPCLPSCRKLYLPTSMTSINNERICLGLRVARAPSYTSVNQSVTFGSLSGS